MITLTLLVILFLPIAFLFSELYRRKRYGTLPPGPPTVPFFGNVLDFVNVNAPKHEVIAKMSEKYGDMFTLWFFNKPTVFLTSIEAVRQTFMEQQLVFSSRPPCLLGVGLADGWHNDLTFGRYSEKWQAKRKLFHNSVRSISATPQFEADVNDIIQRFINILLNEKSEAIVDIESHVHAAIYNVTLAVAFGKRFEYDDPEFQRFVDMHNDANRGVSTSRFYDHFLPFSDYIPIFRLSPALRNMKKALGFFQPYLKQWLVEARENFSGDAKDNMVQAMANGVNQAEEKKDNGRQTYVFDNDEISHALMNLITASTMPTSSTTLWILLEMIDNPDIQEKCYQELQKVTNGRRATLSDRQHMPYIEACLMEILRRHSPVTLNFPRCSLDNAALGDYVIPGETETVINIWALHNNPKFWKDPTHFNPENFLDDNGQLVRPVNYLPFGAGRRVCPGDLFARNLIFLTFTQMLQQLRFEKVPGCQYNTDWSYVGSEFNNIPAKYVIKFVERNQERSN